MEVSCICCKEELGNKKYPVEGQSFICYKCFKKEPSKLSKNVKIGIYCTFCEQVRYSNQCDWNENEKKFNDICKMCKERVGIKG